jgi:membrane-associated phospholipid phosphatase
MQILNRVKDRASRASEILVQDGAEGAIGCWLNILGIDPVRHPATNLLLRIGRRIGEHVVMCLKDHFKSPRPPQLSLAIYPLVNPPATPSFPAGHAVQSYLISYLLAYSLKNLPQHQLPDAPEDAKGLLFDLAARVADNRVVAGIHYPVDIDAGRAVAIACFNKLKKLDSIIELQAEVAKELKQYA